MKMVGSMRMWFSGLGRLPEYPDVELKTGDESAPTGANSCLDVKLDDLGEANGIIALLEKLVSSPRYVKSSVRFMIQSYELRKRMEGNRYRKGEMILTKSDTYCHTLWGFNPKALLAEREALEKGMDDGWLEEPIFVRHPEGEVSPIQVATDVYVLKERPVVDMLAAIHDAVRIRVITAAVAGAAAGLILSQILR